MIVEDPDWVRIFGTTDSQIEPVPKIKKTKLESHQHEAKLIVERPELFGASKPVKRAATLFEKSNGV